MTVSLIPAVATNVTSFQNLLALVTAYLEGLHFADIQKLRNIFHSDAILKAPGLRLSLEDWLQKVATRPRPADNNTQPAYRILAIEIHEDEAMIKVECPLFENFYIDYLGLLFENGK